MAREYPYIAVADNYFCTHCSLLSLTRIFLFRYKKLYLGAFDIQRRQLPTLLKAIWKFRKNGPSATTDAVSLPISGDLCIPVHHGYKIFDLSRLTATKYFTDDVESSVIQAEVNRVRDASGLPFTPELLEVDPDGRWYRESFIPGDRSSRNDKSDPPVQFRETIGNYLAKIVHSRPDRMTSVDTYLRGLENSLKQKTDTLGADDELCPAINAFICRVAARLEPSRQMQIQIAFTHGDFSFVNFIFGRKGITIIDWEGADYRSLLHDLYNYFFTEHYYGRYQPINHDTFTDAIEHFGLCLAAEGGQPGDTRTLSGDVYRLLYYLERMQMLLDRKASPEQRNVILRSIEIFDQYESGRLQDRTPQANKPEAE